MAENMYGMSDEDFLNADPDSFFAAAEAPSGPQSDSSEEPTQSHDDTGTVPENGAEGVSEPENLDDDEYIDEDTSEATSEPDAESADEEDEESEDPESEPNDEENVEDESDEDVEDDSQEDTGSEDSSDSPTAEDFLAPLKHHGSEFKPKDINEARRLMSMGLDYARKTKALKEQRKYLKMLDNNQLLDEEKLNFVIDVMRGEKDAVAKLVQDAKLDVMDFDEDVKYTPTNHTVGDHEVELQDVLENMRSTATYADTMKVVDSWDDSSKRALAKHPNDLSVINQHMESGIYKLVQEEIAHERALGGYANLSDFEAYMAAGEKLYRQGAFTLPSEGTQKKAEPTKAPAKRVVKTAPQAEAKKDAALHAKRKAASPVQRKAKKQPKPQVDFWELSDEEFEKFSF